MTKNVSRWHTEVREKKRKTDTNATAAMKSVVVLRNGTSVCFMGNICEKYSLDCLTTLYEPTQ